MELWRSSFSSVIEDIVLELVSLSLSSWSESWVSSFVMASRLFWDASRELREVASSLLVLSSSF